MRKLVRDSVGTLAYESLEGVGTTFVVALSALPGHGVKPLAGRPPPNLPRALVVCHEPGMRQQLEQALAAELRVSVQPCAASALAQLAAGACYELHLVRAGHGDPSGLNFTVLRGRAARARRAPRAHA